MQPQRCFIIADLLSVYMFYSMTYACRRLQHRAVKGPRSNQISWFCFWMWLSLRMMFFMMSHANTGQTIRQTRAINSVWKTALWYAAKARSDWIIWSHSSGARVNISYVMGNSLENDSIHKTQESCLDKEEVKMWQTVYAGGDGVGLSPPFSISQDDLHASKSSFVLCLL